VEVAEGVEAEVEVFSPSKVGVRMVVEAGEVYGTAAGAEVGSVSAAGVVEAGHLAVVVVQRAQREVEVCLSGI
jgi:hypothetical protein